MTSAMHLRDVDKQDSESWLEWWDENIEAYVTDGRQYECWDGVPDVFTSGPAGMYPLSKVMEHINKLPEEIQKSALQGLIEYASDLDGTNRSKLRTVLELGQRIQERFLPRYNLIKSGVIDVAFFDAVHGAYNREDRDRTDTQILNYGHKHMVNAAYVARQLSARFNESADVVDICKKIINRVGFDDVEAASLFETMVAADPENIFSHWQLIRESIEQENNNHRKAVLGVHIAKIIDQDALDDFSENIDTLPDKRNIDQELITAVKFGLAHKAHNL